MYYCVLSTSEDGDVSLRMMDKETLLKRLNENHWGNQPVKQITPGEYHDVRERHGIYIIAGESVIPKPKAVVAEWDI